MCRATTRLVVLRPAPHQENVVQVSSKQGQAQRSIVARQIPKTVGPFLQKTGLQVKIGE